MTILRGLEGFELHRRGLGLLPQAGGPAGSAIFVRVEASARPIRSCTCRDCHGGKTCDYLRQLGVGARYFTEELGGDFSTSFEKTLWFRLAKVVHGAAPLPCDQAKVQQVERVATGDMAVRVLNAKGEEVARYVESSPARIAFLERTGKVSGEQYTDRGALIARLAMYQVTEQERQFEKHGMMSKGRAWASSFWYRLAYHAVRTWGDVGWPERLGLCENAGTFHPAIETSTGAFNLIHRLADGQETVKIVLPRKRVEAILELLREFYPDQEDLQVHPVPLESLFRVSQETELDLEVRPMIKVLQHSGEAKLYDRRDFEKYRYGQLFYLRELGLLARLPRRRESAAKFKAPVKMRLARSQVPAFLDEHVEALEEGSLVLDEPLQGLKIWKSYDRVEVSGDPVTGGSRSAPGAYRLSVRYGFGDLSVSLADLLRARREKRPYFETSDGWVDLRAPAFAELERLERRRVDAESDGSEAGSDGEAADKDAVLLSAGELIRLQAALERPLDVTGPEDRSAVLRRLLDQRPPSPWSQPDGFLSQLRPYQVIGVDWLRFLAEQGLGGLLCDDMGLGKTHQAMALMAALASGGGGPALVVAPTSVMSHWRDKLRRFAPALESRTYHGADRSLAGLGPRHVVITSYGVLRRDIDEIEKKSFHIAVFDEIQYLKNRGTVSYEAAARLPTAVKLGLTGTPIENSLDELKTLFDLVLPGYLGTDEAFHGRYDRALQTIGAGMKENRARLDELRRVIGPFVLRRLKSSVLDELPEKIEDERLCTLSPEQVALYRQV
ncbi:MAG: DEAD/DEAH box helicase, partial [Acidobacteriota bacterium]